MKAILLFISGVLTLSAFSHVDKVSCAVTNISDNKTVEVKVYGEGSAAGSATTLSLKNFDETKTSVRLSAAYNGVSDKMKPGASGQYTLTVYVSKPYIFEEDKTFESGVLLFSASFPLSGTVLGGLIDNIDDDLSDVSTVSVTCQ